MVNPNIQTSERRPWVAPAVRELPRLTELTLQTGGGVPGGGCTVFCGGWATGD